MLSGFIIRREIVIIYVINLMSDCPVVPHLLKRIGVHYIRNVVVSKELL